MQTQDTQLAEVGATIGTLKTMGAAIGDELEDQNRWVFRCWYVSKDFGIIGRCSLVFTESYIIILLACLQKNRLLDEIDLEMDSTSEKLKRTIAKVDTVLAISKGKIASWYLNGFLTIANMKAVTLSSLYILFRTNCLSERQFIYFLLI